MAFFISSAKDLALPKIAVILPRCCVRKSESSWCCQVPLAGSRVCRRPMMAAPNANQERRRSVFSRLSLPEQGEIIPGQDYSYHHVNQPSPQDSSFRGRGNGRGRGGRGRDRRPAQPPPRVVVPHSTEQPSRGSVFAQEGLKRAQSRHRSTAPARVTAKRGHEEDKAALSFKRPKQHDTWVTPLPKSHHVLTLCL